MSNQFGVTDKPFGFWYSQWEPGFPLPATSDYARADELAYSLELIESKAIEERYRGFSICRICQCMNGISTFIYKKGEDTYIWPSGFRHYLTAHRIQPPAFLLELLEIK